MNHPHSPLPEFIGRRGMAAVLAMLFLMLATTLAVGMYAMATMNTQSGRNLSDADHARATRRVGPAVDELAVPDDEPPEDDDRRDLPTVADSLWPSIRTSITTTLRT